jgi:hypothetical protein
VRNNVFGATTIAEVAYLPNSEGVAIRATDSGRPDRPDLGNVDIVGNVLNGEVIIKCCELPEEIVWGVLSAVVAVGIAGAFAWFWYGRPLLRLRG